ncbi:hypothetical protein BS78_08G156400 [Paspalum vaginatum]|nr:hypothetical protein BS78_08G156400 [Paspalum vaginatum]
MQPWRSGAGRGARSRRRRARRGACRSRRRRGQARSGASRPGAASGRGGASGRGRGRRAGSRSRRRGAAGPPPRSGTPFTSRVTTSDSSRTTARFSISILLRIVVVCNISISNSMMDRCREDWRRSRRKEETNLIKRHPCTVDHIGANE